MNCLTRLVLAGLTGAALIGAGVSDGSAQPASTPIGTLRCMIEGPDVALHFASKRKISCVYRPDGPGKRQYYRGKFRKYGVEIGVIGETSIEWRVLSDTPRLRYGALAGTYRGFTVEAAVGAGSGANVLVREGNDDIALDLGMQVQLGGLNAALGITQLELRPVRR